MTQNTSRATPMVEVWRGPIAESVHMGHAVICDGAGEMIEAWGDPTTMILPRSSAKMLQALPLIESGAADARGLTPEQLALSCASHNGDAIHTTRVSAWMDDLGLGEPDLRCGAHPAMGIETQHGMIREGHAPCQLHNNCSGKHAGFLTLAGHIGAGPEYVEPEHPVQQACLAAFQEVTDEVSPGFGIDGCSAPNHACTMHGMARAMGRFAAAREGSDTRQNAMVRLWQAMVAHPDLVAGEGRACTVLMRACSEPVALKTGAEGFYIAILPKRNIGVALKIVDGATRASECAIAALLVRLGVLDAAHPDAQRYMNAPLPNARGIVAAHVRAAPALLR